MFRRFRWLFFEPFVQAVAFKAFPVLGLAAFCLPETCQLLGPGLSSFHCVSLVETLLRTDLMG